MRISPSQIKTFCASKAKRAGQYILGIKDTYANDAFLLGQIFENYLVTGKDMFEETIGEKEVEDMGKLVETYDNLKNNIGDYKFEIGRTQVKVEGKLFGCDVIGYIDNLTEERVEDIKTSKHLTKLDTTTKNMWSGMTTMEEYELQLWIYSKLLGRTKARIIEFCKHIYKDNRQGYQIIEFDFSDDTKMIEKFKPIIEEMKVLFTEYKQCY